MRSLKALVVVMGILIALVSGLLVYGLMQRSTDPNFSFFAKAPSATVSPAAPATPSAPLATNPVSGSVPFGDVTVRLPAGCTIEDMRPDGGRLFVRVGPAGACTQIVVVDLASGKVLGNVKFWNAP